MKIKTEGDFLLLWVFTTLKAIKKSPPPSWNQRVLNPTAKLSCLHSHGAPARRHQPGGRDSSSPPLSHQQRRASLPRRSEGPGYLGKGGALLAGGGHLLVRQPVSAVHD